MITEEQKEQLKEKVAPEIDIPTVVRENGYHNCLVTYTLPTQCVPIFKFWVKLHDGGLIEKPV